MHMAYKTSCSVQWEPSNMMNGNTLEKKKEKEIISYTHICNRSNVIAG